MRRKVKNGQSIVYWAMLEYSTINMYCSVEFFPVSAWNSNCICSCVSINSDGVNLTMSDVPQTDVSRPSALPTARLHPRKSDQRSSIEQNSAEYLDTIEEEWNKKIDVEIDTLVDGMVDIVNLASVCYPFMSPLIETF